MLGRVRPDGSPLISAADLKEGVITFEDEGDAERFAGLLEADGHPQVCRVYGPVMSLDSFLEAAGLEDESLHR